MCDCKECPIAKAAINFVERKESGNFAACSFRRTYGEMKSALLQKRMAGPRPVYELVVVQTRALAVIPE